MIVVIDMKAPREAASTHASRKLRSPLGHAVALCAGTALLDV